MTSLSLAKNRSRNRMRKLFRSSALCGVIVVALTAQANVSAQAATAATPAPATITVGNAQVASDGGVTMDVTVTAASPNRCTASFCTAFLTATCEAGPRWVPRWLGEPSVVTVHAAGNGIQLPPGASTYTDPAFRTDPCPPDQVGPFLRAVYSSPLDYQQAGGSVAALSDVYYVGAAPTGAGTGLAIVAVAVTPIVNAAESYLAAGREEEICLRLYPLFPKVPGSSMSVAYAVCQAMVFARNYWKVIVATIAIGGIAALILLPSDPVPCPGPCRPTPPPVPTPTPTPIPVPVPTPCPGCGANPDPDLALVRNRLLAENARLDLSPEAADAAARQCLAMQAAAVAAGKINPGARPCVTDPIFIPGGADAGAAAFHDLKAIATGQSFQLTYLDKDVKNTNWTLDGVSHDPVPESWYNRVAYHEKCYKKGRGKKAEACDEYPFYSTVEGGPGASLEIVPFGENSAEGGALGRMYNDVQCNMANPGNIGSGTRTFIVLPLAAPTGLTNAAGNEVFAGPRSYHVCKPAPAPDPGPQAS